MKRFAIALVLVAVLGGCSMITQMMGLDFESQLAAFAEQLEAFRGTAEEVKAAERD